MIHQKGEGRGVDQGKNAFHWHSIKEKKVEEDERKVEEGGIEEAS